MWDLVKREVLTHEVWRGLEVSILNMSPAGAGPGTTF